MFSDRTNCNFGREYRDGRMLFTKNMALNISDLPFAFCTRMYKSTLSALGTRILRYPPQKCNTIDAKVQAAFTCGRCVARGIELNMHFTFV